MNRYNSMKPGHFQPLVSRRTTATVEMHYNRDYEGHCTIAYGLRRWVWHLFENHPVRVPASDKTHVF